MTNTAGNDAGTTTQPAMSVPSRRREIAAGTFGNLVVWYDWISYGLLAPVFAPAFFPGSDSATALLYTLASFAIGFLVRPLGGVVLGRLGDRLGRRPMMAVTVLMMGGGSLLIAVAPTYHQIGVAAPVLLVLARCVQGLSAGAEFAISSVFLVEHSPPNRRGLVGALQNVSVGLGGLLGSGVASLIISVLPAEAAAEWGWRVAFGLGALASAFGLYLRMRVEETAAFDRVRDTDAVPSTPLLTVLRTYPRESLRIVGMSMGETFCYYLFTVYLPTYGHVVGGLPLSQTLAVNSLSLLIFVVLMPVVGVITDNYIDRKPLMVAQSVGFIVLAYPMLTWAGSGSLLGFSAASIIAAVLLALVEGNLPAAYCEQFPARVRATGVAVPYALCAALFGGTAPLLTEHLVRAHQPTLVAGYAILLQLITGWVYLRLRRTDLLDRPA